MSTATAEVRELRGHIRHWRRGRADTRLIDALSDAYIAVFATVMLGSMAISVIVHLRTVAGQACTGSACVDARASLPWVFALSVVTVGLALARLFGPMLVSPAVGSWLLTAPVDRAALLRPHLVGTGLGCFALGAVLSAVASALAGFGTGAVAAFAVTLGALCLAGLGFACIAQAAGSPAVRVATWTLAGLVWLGLVLLARGAVPWSTVEPQYDARWLVALVAAGLLAVAAVARAWTVLHRLRRDQLTPGGSLVPGLSGALAGLDFALVYDILVARHWRTRTVRTVRGRGLGAGALVWRDVVRLRRSPQLVVVLAAALVLPYLTGTLGLGRLVLLVGAATGFVAGLGLFSALRVLSRTPSLVRAIPLEPWRVKTAVLAVPGAVLLLWGLGTAPVVHTATGLPWPGAGWVAFAVGAAALAAVVRWLTGRPPDYQLPLVTSPMGAVPTSLYVSAARGLDVLILSVAPLLLFPTPGGAQVSLALSAIVLTVLVNRN